MSDTNVDIAELAHSYRRLILWAGFFLLTSAFSTFLEFMSPKDAVFFANFHSFLIAVGFIAMALYAYRMSKAFGSSQAGLWAMAVFFPVINLITLWALSSRGTKMCRAAGIQVGFLGPKQTSPIIEPPGIPDELLDPSQMGPIIEPTGDNSAAPRYFATSPAKFVAMSLCTFGLYELYWSYKNWKIIKDRDSSKIMPVWRSFFYPLWHYSLLTELNKTLESRALSSGTYRIMLAAGVLILNASWRLPDPYWLVSFLTFLGFLPALLAMQMHATIGARREQTKSFHQLNLIAYVFGGPLLVFTALSSTGFLPGTAVVTGDAMRDRDIEYLREETILGPDEEIIYFYSAGTWSIAEDGQFFSEEYVTAYYQDPDTGEAYVDYVSYPDIRDIDVWWAESFLDFTVVIITTSDKYQFELWLSQEAGGDREFVKAMKEIWRKSKESM